MEDKTSAEQVRLIAQLNDKDPLSNDLILTVGLQFYYNYGLQRWELSQNPYEDAKPIPINNVILSTYVSRRSFHANYHSKEQAFEVTCRFQTEKILLEFFSCLYDAVKLPLPEDLDDYN